MSLNDIKLQLSLKINIDILQIELWRIFPVFDIISAGFENGQYWASLAMNWIESLSSKDKILFLNGLEILATAKWAGQNLRQRAYREIKNIKRYIDKQMNE